MNQSSRTDLERRLYEDARAFEYPPTPDIAASVNWNSQHHPHDRAVLFSGPRLAMALVLLLVVLTGLMAVPTVRAQILDFLQIGSVRIFLSEPTAPPSPATSSAQPTSDLATSDLPQSGIVPPTATPATSLSPPPTLLNLSGKTSLIQAQDQVGFHIRLPGYPEGLGSPDHVFVENIGGPIVVLVWLQPNGSEEVALTLMQLSPGAVVEKTPPRAIEEVQVNDQPAIWAEGRHQLRYRAASGPVELVVDGNVLIWKEGEITFRLAGDFTLDEALRIAESLQ